MTHPSHAALADRLLEHAKLHDDLAKHSDEQKQWGDDLREAADLLRSQQPAPVVNQQLTAQPVSGGERERCARIAAKWYRQCHMRMDIGGEAIAIRIGHEIDGAAFVASIEDKAIAAEAAKLINNIAARLSAPQAVGWLPIESAPKDGTEVAAIGNNYGDPKSGTHRCIAYFRDGAWWCNEWNDSESELKYLTGWSPLPAPPTQQGDSNG